MPKSSEHFSIILIVNALPALPDEMGGIHDDVLSGILLIEKPQKNQAASFQPPQTIAQSNRVSAACP